MSPHSNDDNLEAQLRRALTAEADMVNPAGDGLGRIRAGIDAPGQRVWWRNPMVALAAAAVIGLALGAGTMVLNNDDDGGELVAEQPTASASATPSPDPSPPSETPSPSESPTEDEAAAVRMNLAIYYVGSKDNDEDPRLYREFHTLPPIGDDRIRTALTEMFRGQPADPDYMSLWPKDAKVLDVDTSGDTAVINLNQAATRANVGSGSAEVTMQQLVYTVTAADPSVKRVQLRVEGKAVRDLWGHIQVGTKTFMRARMVDVQGLIWLLEPKEGEKVDDLTMGIKGFGTAFEGTVNWEILGTSDKVVAKGFTQAGANGEFAEFTDTVVLKEGTYTIRAFESSAEDGRPLHVDDKTFTVEYDN